jgi:hypothetical protein
MLLVDSSRWVGESGHIIGVEHDRSTAAATLHLLPSSWGGGRRLSNLRCDKQQWREFV